MYEESSTYLRPSDDYSFGSLCHMKRPDSVNICFLSNDEWALIWRSWHEELFNSAGASFGTDPSRLQFALYRYARLVCHVIQAFELTKSPWWLQSQCPDIWAYRSVKNGEFNFICCSSISHLKYFQRLCYALRGAKQYKWIPQRKRDIRKWSHCSQWFDHVCISVPRKQRYFLGGICEISSLSRVLVLARISIMLLLFVSFRWKIAVLLSYGTIEAELHLD